MLNRKGWLGLALGLVPGLGPALARANRGLLGTAIAGMAEEA
jgi:hypothetical protein